MSALDETLASTIGWLADGVVTLTTSVLATSLSASLTDTDKVSVHTDDEFVADWSAFGFHVTDGLRQQNLHRQRLHC